MATHLNILNVTMKFYIVDENIERFNYHYVFWGNIIET